MKLPMLIGLAGKAGAGKDTVARYLWMQHKYERVAIACPLKEMLIAALDKTPPPDWIPTQGNWREKLYGSQPKTQFVRWLLQFVGTDIVRNHIDTSYWVDHLEHKLDELMWKGVGVVVTDMRFRLEADFVQSLGGKVWRIIRPEEFRSEHGGHVSETELDNYNYWDATIINDGTREQLYERVEKELKVSDQSHILVALEVCREEVREGARTIASLLKDNKHLVITIESLQRQIAEMTFQLDQVSIAFKGENDRATSLQRERQGYYDEASEGWSKFRKAQLAVERLRGALGDKEVEWSAGPYRNKCPWCDGLHPDHKRDCKRQEVLA